MGKEYLIPNGGFETGDFDHWTVQNFGTPANVVKFGTSYQAKMEPGADTGQLLYTRFKAGHGPFTLELKAYAPEADFVGGTPRVETHPMVFFFFSGFQQDGRLVQSDIGMWWLTRAQKSFQYIGNMRSEVVDVEVRLSFPSDPRRVKGPLYIDNVSHKLNAPKPSQPYRWSE